MRLIRLFLAVLLSVTLPVMSASSIAMSLQQEKCPMQADMGSAMGADHDCCDPEAGSPGHEGSPCKSIEMCKTCAVLYPVSSAPAPTFAVQPSSEAVVVRIADHVPSNDPSGLWRPPRSI
ncbi:MAG: hypothetical protein K2X64_05235 [Rhodocyclaceae bacterium]|nr:hypothetical protein [Rhodocyclaceae bacterium]